MSDVMRPVVILFVAAAAAVTGACASTGAVPRPFPSPGGAPRAASAPADATARPEARPAPPAAGPVALNTYALTGTALSLRGIPYRNGGTDPNGFDCSGFTQYVFAQHGIQLPREVKEQFSAGKRVKPEEVAPGDLLFFSTVTAGASHVGISLGGDEFVHAPSSTGVVRVERVTSSYWLQRFVGAKRIS